MSIESVKIENLNVFYSEKQVLHNVNLSFDKNSINCIIGQSGCGKTTLIKCINKSICYIDKAKMDGQIYIEGQNQNDINDLVLRKMVGIVSQTPIVFPFSIYENLTYPLDYHFKLSKNDKKNKIIDALTKVKLYDDIKDKLKTSAMNLSGGEKQRLCIARTLLTEPKVLLLDEPCSALDNKNREAIEKMLIELKKEVTIIIITHNISEAKAIEDKTIFINDGKVVEEGHNIIDNPTTIELKEFLRI